MENNNLQDELKLTDEELHEVVEEIVSSYFEGWGPLINKNKIDYFKKYIDSPDEVDEYLENSNVIVKDEYIIRSYTDFCCTEVEEIMESSKKMGYKSIKQYLIGEDIICEDDDFTWASYIADYLDESFCSDEFYMTVDGFRMMYDEDYGYSRINKSVNYYIL